MKLELLPKYIERWTFPFKKLFWFITRPRTRAVKCLVQYEEKFLLVRIGYSHKLWTIPGGGVDAGESFDDAARREIKEEAGINLAKIEIIGTYEKETNYRRDVVEVFHAKVDSPEVKIDNYEIIDARWFGRDELPKDRVTRVDELFVIFDQARKNNA